MPARSSPAVLLPSDLGPPPHTRFLSALITSLRQLVAHVAERLDSGPFHLAIYTTATRPPAADHPGGMIFVSDAAAGQLIQYSDGTNWVAAG